MFVYKGGSQTGMGLPFFFVHTMDLPYPTVQPHAEKICR